MTQTNKRGLTLVLDILAIVISLIVLASLLSGCATRQQRAQKKLARAIALDPEILKSKSSIKDSIRITDSVRVKDSVTIIPKTETRINWESPCDTNGKIKPINFRTGTGPYSTHIWTDSLGNLHFYNKIDSVVNKTKELEKKSTKQEKTIEYQEKVITVIKYKVILWQLAAAAIFGFFVAFLPTIFKWVLSKIGRK